MKTHFTELAIVTAVECLNEVYYDKIICNILISNLNLIDQHNLKVSSALKEKLSNFLSNYLKNFNSFVDLENEDFAQILNLISLLLEFQDSTSRYNTIEIIFPLLLTSCKKVLQTVNTDTSSELKKLINLFRIIETLLKSISKLEQNSKIYCVLIALEDLLSEAFLIRSQSILVYSFSLLSSYYEVMNSTRLIQRIWSNAVNNIYKDKSYSEFYLIMISYMIGSSFGKKELSEIMNNDDFWTALQLCLEDEHCVQKHALHVLKYAVFNLCNEDFCEINRSSVLNCAHINDHNSWWKTYFIIMENLDEKQTHLVLPVFSLLNNLINNENIVADTFWILRLLESGLKHDSRTVRIEALLFLLNVNVSSLNKDHIPYFVRIILTTLNDSFLFRKAFKTSKFEDLRNKIAKWMNDLSSEENFEHIFKNFYKMMIQQKWSPVPLFYTLKSITEGDDFECLDSSLIILSADTISNITRFHNIKIRAAIQCLFIEFLLKYSKKNESTALTLLETLNNFNEEECLLRNVNNWRLITKYLRQSVQNDFLETYISGTVNPKIDCQQKLTDCSALSAARIAILFEDAFWPKNCSNQFSTWITSFENFLHRPYANKKMQNNRLKLIIELLRIERSVINTRCDKNISMYYHDLAKNNFTHLLAYIIESMLDCEDFEMIDFYDNSLNELFQSLTDEFSAATKTASLIKWVTQTSICLKHEKENIRYASLKFVSWVYRVIYQYPKIHNVGKLRSILFSCVIDLLKNRNIIYMKKESSSRLENVSGKVYSSFTNSFWSTIEICLHFENDKFFNEIEESKLLTMILEALDLARKENIMNILKTIRILFSNEAVVKNETAVLQVIRVSWKCVEDTSTTPYYVDCLKYWIEAFYQEAVIRMKIYHKELLQNTIDLLKKISDDGGSTYYSGILIVTELSKISNVFHVFPDVIQILIDIFCVTHINRKDQRIENETIEYIRGLDDSISVNQIKKYDFDDFVGKMRLQALNLLLTLYKREEDNKEKCSKVIKLLTRIEDNNKKRYFNDSAVHRIKHKKLQLLLIFETVLYKISPKENEYSKELFSFAVNSILMEPHQPSVRYMLEWLLVRLIIHFPELENDFWNCFAEASEERIGSICSFISVAFHFTKITRKESIIVMAIKAILPWTMAQHFNARLYAQTVLVKLIEMNNDAMEKFSVIRDSLRNSLKTGNAVKNAAKLQQDFYFSYFHAIDHFSLETILWDLPRLSNICEEEWIAVNLYGKCLLGEYDGIPITNRIGNFSNFVSSSWIAKATFTVYEEKNSPIEPEVVFQDSQKKFIPDADFSISTSLKKEKAGDLIVVASLIDRAPNLGGLTRTCEIFAVSTLVVNNLKIINNKEYTALSITAEKHIEIIEVKRYHLFSYLKSKKEEGYSVIGAEQTVNSQSLHQFIFPKKTVLVLGNEKEGIPADLLPLLDICVEIPQKGVIRSLNVHVSASLFVWEYAKQHLF